MTNWRVALWTNAAFRAFHLYVWHWGGPNNTREGCLLIRLVLQPMFR